MKRWVCASLLTVLGTAIGARSAAGQTVCYPVGRGDSAALIAERLTGDPAARRAPWFEIVDNRGSLVAKADYDAIRPGWVACLPRSQMPLYRPRDPAPRRAPAVERQGSVDFTFLIVAMLLIAAVLLLHFGTHRVRQRRERVREMQRFGARFVQEFGRPATEVRGASPPPRARLRMRARRCRVEVLLAPPDGGSYPNLADHRNNVRYDVARVMAAVGREAFVNGPPYSEGPWVVLPFHFKGPVQREGAR